MRIAGINQYNESVKNSSRKRYGNAVLSLTLFFNNASIKNSKQAHTDTGANKG